MAAKRGNVPACKHCTRLDHRNERFRARPCHDRCWIEYDIEQSGMPLSRLIVKLDKYSDADLAKADPAKAAEHYGVSVDHAAGYIRLAQEQRGLR